jgi:uncharacterized protein YjbJ (UPF0337 family)
MNDDIFKGKWLQLKGQIKEKWGKLTDDDIDQIGGQKDQLLGRIQERYGYAKDEASREVDAFFDESRPRTSGAGS